MKGAFVSAAGTSSHRPCLKIFLSREHTLKKSPTIAVLLFALSASLAFGAPIAFDEISFLVRTHDTNESISQQITQRRLLRILTPPQEVTLKGEGASDAFIQALRNPNIRLTESEAVAFETRREQQKKSVQATAVAVQEEARAALAAMMREREAAESAVKARTLAISQEAAQIAALPPALPYHSTHYGIPLSQPEVYVPPVTNNYVSPAMNNYVPPAANSLFRNELAVSPPSVVSIPAPYQSRSYTGGYAPSRSPSSFQRIGNAVYDSNGGITQNIGNFWYHPDNTITQKIGSTYYNSGGARTQTIGDFQYHSNGTTTQRIGNFYYHSDGTSSQVIGNTIYNH